MQTVTDQNRFLQTTLKGAVHFLGQGLHTGKAARVSLLPAEADTGYLFRRLDVAAPYNQVAARWINVTGTHLSTTIGNSFGCSVQTIEHLLAALSACGVDNCRIDISGPEIPVLDGSSAPFVEQIGFVGIKSLSRERKAAVITKPVWVEAGQSKAGFIPFPEFWLDMTIDFQHSLIGEQRFVSPVDEETFTNNIAPSRTFGFSEQIETLKKLGFAKGGSLDNAVLINEDRIVNPEGLRFEDELVRHKALDAIGDLALFGVPILGCFVGERSGHKLNNLLLRKLMMKDDCWRFTTLRQGVEDWQQLMAGSETSDGLEAGGNTSHYPVV